MTDVNPRFGGAFPLPLAAGSQLPGARARARARRVARAPTRRVPRRCADDAVLLRPLLWSRTTARSSRSPRSSPDAPCGRARRGVTRRRLLILVASALALAIGAGVGYVLAKRAAAEDVTGSPTEEFVTTDTPAPKPPPKPAPTPSPSPLDEGIAWPTWGYDNERVRVSPYAPPTALPGASGASGARQLIEFPPAVAFGRLYFSNNGGTTFAVRAKDGKLVWKHAARALHGVQSCRRRSHRLPGVSSTGRPATRSASPFSLDGAGRRVRRAHRRRCVGGRPRSGRPSRRRSSSVAASTSATGAAT